MDNSNRSCIKTSAHSCPCSKFLDKVCCKVYLKEGRCIKWGLGDYNENTSKISYLEVHVKCKSHSIW